MMQVNEAILDTKVGLRVCMGDEALYRELLMRFEASQASFETSFDARMKKGLRDEARLIAHTLKSLASSIGAHTVQKEAAKLEYALLNKEDTSHIDVLKKLTCNALQALLAILKQHDVSQPKSVHVSSDDFSALVHRLKQQLRSYDAKARDTAERLGTFWDNNSKEKEAWDAIKAQVDAYAYDEAIVLLEKIEERCYA